MNIQNRVVAIISRTVLLGCILLAVAACQTGMLTELKPIESPEHSDFKQWLCGEYVDKSKAPKSAQLTRDCSPGTGGTQVLEKKTFRCKGNKGDVVGRCADSWWEHFWDDLPYCRDTKFWCEWGGGTWEVLK